MLSGVPSTLHAKLTGASVTEATLAAGSIALPREDRPLVLLAAAAPVHAALSLGWGVALASVLPRRHTVVAGIAGGLAIAALDLGVIGRRLARVRALPTAPQVADHVAYGAVVGAVVARRRTRRDQRKTLASDGIGPRGLGTPIGRRGQRRVLHLMNVLPGLS